MVRNGGYDKTEIDPFLKIVPDYQDAKACIAAKGHWADGEPFAK
jgi:hypothetical protein